MLHLPFVGSRLAAVDNGEDKIVVDERRNGLMNL
jgi:hypothetical protein